MVGQSSFRIFNASAGSGKTFTLVREYLNIILAPGNAKNFRQILAITFTNKAVSEMKSRILDSLFEFATQPPSANKHPLFLGLCETLSCSPEYLHDQSGIVLKHILHNYAFFDVSTIDKFTHRVIRSFSRDLSLPSQFEVILEESLLLQEAVGRLLSKAGKEEELTDTLVAFSLEKIDAEKSWDISYDLNEVGKLLFDENHLGPLQKLTAKSSGDFKKLKSLLQGRIRNEEKQMKEAAHQILQLIASHQLETKDFTRGFFPNFVQQVYEGKQTINFKAGWKQNFGEQPLYSQKVPENTKQVLDELLPEFNRLFTVIKSRFFTAAYLKNAYSNLVPLAIMRALKEELDTLCKERELLPISYFNRIIADEIKDQPAPYIYERIGEKYRHYFIDEFQDTSALQWSNLVPLISNALEGQDESGRKGSLLLVGDAKQAIYRWRGGKAEQFLNLLNPGAGIFTVPPEIHDLPRNYRSHERIIDFNNEFFKITSTALSNRFYEALFKKGATQEANDLREGLVTMEFLDKDEQDLDLKYGECIITYIDQAIKKGYQLKDICVLTRKVKQGIQVAEYLMEREIPVISSETLLLNSSEEVRFCVALLRFSIFPEDLQARFELICYLRQKSAKAQWALLNDSKGLINFLNDTFQFDGARFHGLNTYDALEYAIGCFGLSANSDAYLSFLLDEVLRVAQIEGNGIASFLSVWDKRKDKLSIVAPEGLDAIKIMTIHKAKGLEFPVVIFPFANSDIYDEKNPKLWSPLNPEDFYGFEYLLFSKKKEMLQYNASMKALFEDEQAKLELDAFNLLYVALTRSICALHIITEYGQNSTSEIRNYADLFVKYLQAKGQWDPARRSYSLGVLPDPPSPGGKENGLEEHYVPFSHTAKPLLEHKMVPKKSGDWDSDIGKALVWGNLFHDLMAQIQCPEDIPEALNNVSSISMLDESESKILEVRSKELVTHPELYIYFEKGLEVRNETEIITENGLILRPDRLVFRGGEVSILDYKTGKKSKKDREQLNSYAEALEKMGYQVGQQVLIYTQKHIEPVFI